jgi:fructose-bisphosphate aldolase class II
VSVEGEIGCLGSLEHKADADHSQLLTDPDEAVAFVEQTGIDALAVAIGTSHGAYKFSRPPTGDILAIDRIKAINKRIPNTHLVMHGSSSVPQEYLEMIRQFGGDIKETYGVPVEEIVEGIKYGVRKVNIDTDIRLAMTAAMRKTMADKPDEFDPRAFLKAATAAAKKVCRDRFEAFGCAGKASKIKPMNLDAMASLYHKGALRAQVR